MSNREVHFTSNFYATILGEVLTLHQQSLPEPDGAEKAPATSCFINAGEGPPDGQPVKKDTHSYTHHQQDQQHHPHLPKEASIKEKDQRE